MTVPTVVLRDPNVTRNLVMTGDRETLDVHALGLLFGVLGPRKARLEHPSSTDITVATSSLIKGQSISPRVVSAVVC